MHPKRWLEVALGAPSRIRILRLLTQSPGRLWTGRGIAKAIGLSPNGVNKAVRELRRTGLVEVDKAGRSHVVRLDPRMAGEVAGLFRHEEDSWNAVLDQIRDVVPDDTACYVFGSSDRDDVHAESDIDLLVVAADREAALDAAAALQVTVHERFPARVGIIALGRREAAAKAHRGVVRAAIERGRPLTRARLEDLL